MTTLKELQERAAALMKRKTELETCLVYGPGAGQASEHDVLVRQVETLEDQITRNESRLDNIERVRRHSASTFDQSMKDYEENHSEEIAAQRAALEAQNKACDPVENLKDVTWDDRSKAAFAELWAAWNHPRKLRVIRYLKSLDKETRQRKVSDLATVLDCFKRAIDAYGPIQTSSESTRLPIEPPEAVVFGRVMAAAVRDGKDQARSLVRRVGAALDEAIERLDVIHAETRYERLKAQLGPSSSFVVVPDAKVRNP